MDATRALMRRDNISYEEALLRVQVCGQRINETESMWETEDILDSELGLSPDYIPSVMKQVTK